MVPIVCQCQGTHTRLYGALDKIDFDMAEEAGSTWYRSKEPVPIVYPFLGIGYLSNKKWPLMEESTFYMLVEYVNNK